MDKLDCRNIELEEYLMASDEDDKLNNSTGSNDESSSDEPVDEAKEETSSEEVPAEEAVAEEVPAEEAVAEEVPAEEAVAEESTNDTSNDEALEVSNEQLDLSPEEKTKLASQTRIVQATYTSIRKDLPKFRSGDTISIGYRVIEGTRSRIQVFEGLVIKISSGHGLDKTFTVRKISSGIGVERIFPFHSPNIDSIKVLKQGKVRRAKLYYLRDRIGKAARIKERTQ